MRPVATVLASLASLAALGAAGTMLVSAAPASAAQLAAMEATHCCNAVLPVSEVTQGTIGSDLGHVADVGLGCSKLDSGPIIGVPDNPNQRCKQTLAVCQEIPGTGLLNVGVACEPVNAL